MPINLTETFSLHLEGNLSCRFPSNSGFKESKILLYSGEPTLQSLYFNSPSSQKRLFVTDTNVLPLCSDLCSYFNVENEKESLSSISLPAIYNRENDTLCVIEAGEEHKDISSVLSIVKAALDANFNRNSLFIGIGGGVICDMTAFAASIFKRGVDVEFVPTTLLSDVDAAIGGKTGCDFGTYKNMIGSFYPAKKISIISVFIKSLPEKEYISGLGEVIKTAFLFSPELTKLLSENKDEILSRSPSLVTQMILICAKAKAKTVSKDFKEKGIRAFLNYGHTFGHALESVAGLGKITHGEAVAWGIARSLSLASNKGICSKMFAKDCIALLSLYGYETKAMPAILLDIPDALDKLIFAMHKDKKNSNNSVKVIVQSGKQKTFSIEVSDEEIREVLHE